MIFGVYVAARGKKDMAEFPHKPCGQYVEFREVRKGIFGKSKIEVVKKLYNVISGKGGKKGDPHDCPGKFDRPWECEGVDCHQMIMLSSTQTYRSGKHKVINARDGPGGKKGDPHVCPNRVGSIFHRIKITPYTPRRWCASCGTEWFENVFSNCPGCSCLECRKCGHQMLPKVKFPKMRQYEIQRTIFVIDDKETKEGHDEIRKDTAIDWPCPECGDRDTKDWNRWRKNEDK